MPKYEWQCTNSRCHYVTEVERKIADYKDPPSKTCPVCGGSSWVRILSTSTFCLKGGDWSSNGYGTRSKKK